MRTMTKAGLAVVAVLLLASCSSSSSDDTGASGPGWTRITSQDLSEMLSSQDVYLVNVHVPYEGEIPGTDAHISYTDIASQLDRLPSDRTLVIYCRSGNMSTQAAQEMVAAGGSGFYELEGGYLAWTAEGLPFTI